MIPRIFIGGTGRSGTWLLYRILGSHPEIHIFPAELRFLVDPGGLVELVTALTNNYSTALSRNALYHFEQLMCSKLASFGKPPYSAIDLPTWIGRDYYWQRLGQFISAITYFEHEARYWDQELEVGGNVNGLRRKIQSIRNNLQRSADQPRGRATLQLVKEARYYSNRYELINLTSSFVDDLLLNAAKRNQKTTWCEKTPQNLLHLDFIWDLFPDSYFIHIKRDPRGVVFSLSNQNWGPNNIYDASRFTKGVCAKWFDIMANLDFKNHRYIELKLEDLAHSPEEMLTEITSIGGFDNQFNDLPEINQRRVNFWRKQISKEDLRFLNEDLGPFIDRMGYVI